MNLTRKNFFIFVLGVLIVPSLFAFVALVLWRAPSNTSPTAGFEAVVPLRASTSEGPSEIATELKANFSSAIRPVVQPKTDFGRLDPESLKTWKKLMNTTSLSPLIGRALGPDDIEIRIWQLPGLYTVKTKGWVFSRVAGRWDGYALVDVDFKGPIVKVPLDTPSSGWRNWEAFVIGDLSPARLVAPRQVTDQGGDEGMGTVIEVKFGRGYARRLADGDLLNDLFKTIKSEILNSDRERWAKF